LKYFSISAFSAAFFLLFCLGYYQAQVTLTYTFTGSPQSFTVPSCVSSVSLTARGARGGSNALAVPGGLGGTAFGVLSVSPGDVLNIYVGGTNGYNGGGLAGTSPCTAAIGGVGGGGSDVRLNGNSLSNRVIVGGGGGGAGGNRILGCGRGTGGGGGGGYYGGGGGAGFPSNGGYTLATGGSQVAGGIAGNSAFCSCNNGSVGTLWAGGAGGTEVSSNQGANNIGLTGGFGGGLFGGPGQYTPTASSGDVIGTIGAGSSGGGGSSYLGSLLSAYTASGNVGGNGEVIVSYTMNTLPLNLTQANIYICVGSSATLNALSQSSYTWSTGSNASSIIVSPSVTTTYSISATGSQGCPSAGIVTVTVNDSLPSVSIDTSTNSVCQGNPVTLSGNGANSYTWSGGLINGSPFIPTITSTYTVTGYNACGTATALVTVSVNPIPSLSVNPTSTSLCAGIPTTLTASGANSYTWTGGILNGSSFIPTATNVYTVFGSNGFGCIGTATASVTILPSPSLTPVPSPPLLCMGETGTISATGANNYTWMPGGSNASSITVSPTSTSVYSLTQSIGNCVDTKTVSIVVAPFPTVTAFVSDTAICSGMPVTFSATGANSYTWTGNVQNGVPYFPSVTSNYTVTGQNLSGCKSQALVSVSVTPSPSLSPVASQASICTGGSVILSASGASGYTWMPGNSNTTSVSVSPGLTTTYTLVKQNGNCADTQTISIAVLSPPLVQISGPAAICAGQSATMTASGAVSYTWEPAGLFSSTIAINPPQSTSFSVTGSNGACTSSAITNLTVNPNPTLSISASPLIICNGQSVALVAGGGNTYTWTSPASVAGLNSASIAVWPSINTVYGLTGNNVFQCTASISQSIQVVQGPALSAFANHKAMCPGSVLILSASGAQSYTWSAPGGVTSTGQSYNLSPTSTAVYTVFGSSSGNSCAGTATIQAVVFSPNVSVSSPSAICAGSTATLTASGANSYTWNPNSAPFPFQSLLVAPLSNTVYYLSATTSSAGINCVSNHSVALQVNALPNINIIASKESVICAKEQFSLIASGATTYTWSGGQNSATLNVMQAQFSQNFFVSGTSTAGCVSTASLSVKVSECLGITKNSENEFRIYPNPSNGILNIQSEKDGQFSLINDLGQILGSFDVEGGKEYKINGLASGVYFLIGLDVNKPIRVVVFSNP